MKRRQALKTIGAAAGLTAAMPSAALSGQTRRGSSGDRPEAGPPMTAKKTVRLITAALILCGALLSATPAGRAPSDFTINSRILEEDRSIRVTLPERYGIEETSYPMLILLDAESDDAYRKAAVVLERLEAAGEGPGMILIGIRNTIRNRDMIPAAVAHRPGSGGSEHFLRFIREELLPDIRSRFRTAGPTLLYGASNAGLFTVYAMLESPETFDAAIASSPMIGHCPDLMREKAAAFRRKELPGRRVLYMIYGTQDSRRVTEYLPDYQAALSAGAPREFQSETVIVEGEGHVPPDSLIRGLRFVFQRIGF